MSLLSPSLLAELNAAISKHQLESVADLICSHAVECYALVTSGDDDYSSVGNTRFGGDPDLPKDWQWPAHQHYSELRYSNFIAQINFAELPHLSQPTGLPDCGILYLFVREMEGAASPVLLDTCFYAGDAAQLARRVSPDEESLADEYLIELVPQRIKAMPAISLASYQKPLREQIDTKTTTINDADGNLRRIYLEADLRRENQIGQLLGFANAGDERENLYREVVLARLNRSELIYNDYWDSMDDYEAYIEQWRNDPFMVKNYERMRDGVSWLMAHREFIADAVSQWRLLFQLESNHSMNLNINDADPLYVFVRNEDLMLRNFSDLAGRVTQG